MSEEFNPYETQQQQTDYQQNNQPYNQPAYQQYNQPVYQQPYYQPPVQQTAAKNSPAPCIVSMATGIGGLILTGIGAIYWLCIVFFAFIGYEYSGGSYRHITRSPEYSALLDLEMVFVFVVVVFLLLGIAAAVVSLIFGIKGVKERRRLRPMAIVGIVLSSISIIIAVIIALYLIALVV